MSEETKRFILLSEDVSFKSIQDAIRIIIEANEHDEKQEGKVINYKREPIKFIINTYGGSAYGMLGLISVMKTSKTPIHTYGYGAIMSAGLGLFAMGHRRFADSHSTFMYHGVGYGTWGTIPHQEQELGQNKLLQKYYDDIILNNTKIQRADMTDTVNRNAYMYLSGEEALKVGLVDELIEEGLERKRT